MRYTAEQSRLLFDMFESDGSGNPIRSFMPFDNTIPNEVRFESAVNMYEFFLSNNADVCIAHDIYNGIVSIEDMPLHINSDIDEVGTLARWRLKIGI